jgi:hypothetical protein
VSYAILMQIGEDIRTTHSSGGRKLIVVGEFQIKLLLLFQNYDNILQN